MNQSVNQPTNQLVNQSNNQSINLFFLQLDLKQYGMKHLPEDINRGKVETVWIKLVSYFV